MKFYGTLESLLKYSPPSSLKNPPVPKSTETNLEKTTKEKKETTEENTPPDSLENILNEKVQCLSSILAQINHDITSRGGLSQNVIYRIYQHYLYLKTKLYELSQWEFGSSRNVEQRRSNLEKQLDTLKQEKRQEQVQCWQDIVSLKKELRNWFKQYCDLMQRVKIVMPGKDNGKIKKKLSGSP